MDDTTHPLFQQTIPSNPFFSSFLPFSHRRRLWTTAKSENVWIESRGERNRGWRGKKGAWGESQDTRITAFAQLRWGCVQDKERAGSESRCWAGWLASFANIVPLYLITGHSYTRFCRAVSSFRSTDPRYMAPLLEQPSRRERERERKRERERSVIERARKPANPLSRTTCEFLLLNRVSSTDRRNCVCYAPIEHIILPTWQRKS